MAAVIIKQKDLKRLGKEVVKELYDFFNDEYIFNTFPEMKEERKKFLNNLTYQSGISLNLRTGPTGHATLLNQ